MCKARDVALSIIQKSIDTAREKNDPKYFVDYVKLHKMLYLGQCMVLGKCNLRLFEEPVHAHNCGPYIEDSLNFVFNNYGTEPITDIKYEDGREPAVLDLPPLRNEMVDLLIKNFGYFSTWDIVKFTKETAAYAQHRENLDGRPEISLDAMKAVGKELLSNLL